MVLESLLAEKSTEINPDFIHYAHKLEFKLATTKDKIQSERNKFQNIIFG